MSCLLFLAGVAAGCAGRSFNQAAQSYGYVRNIQEANYRADGETALFGGVLLALGWLFGRNRRR